MKKPKLIRITTIPGSFGLLKGQLKFMSKNGFEIIAISSGGERLKQVGLEEGVRVFPVNMTRKITPLQDLKALFLLIRLFNKEKPDIVHTHTPKAGLLGMLAAFITRVPHRLHTVAGMPLIITTGFKRLVLNIIEKITYACATKVYPNSFGLMKFILDNEFTNKEKLKVIGKGSSNGINTSIFDPSLISEFENSNLKSSMNITKNDFVFLFVGRLVRDKGVNELVEAFINVNQIKGNCHLVLVGPYENDLDPLSRYTENHINNHPNIHAVGFKTNVIDYFSITDVFTFPSYREGFPNVVMQACAMQVNCIVSDINGCNEIINNGDNGWVIPVKDIDQLKSKMLWCMNNSALSREMGLKSRKIIQTNYETSFIWNELLKEYNNLK